MNSAIQHIVEHSISSAAFVINNSGKILLKNKKVDEVLSKFDIAVEADNQIDIESKNLLAEAIRNSFDSDELSEKQLAPENENEIEEYNVVITPLEDESENSSLVVFREKLADSKSKYKFYINSDEIEDYLEEENINLIIEKTKSAFPFTFIGRQKFQRDIDKLNGIFLIKDTNGKIIVSNKAFADYVKIKTSQIQGKYFSDYFSAVESEIIHSADSFLNKTKRPILYTISSIAYKGHYVQVPLIDLDGKVVAIICFTSPDKDRVQISKADGVQKLDYIKELRDPVLLYDIKSRTSSASDTYREKFVLNKSGGEIDTETNLPIALLKKFEEFIEDSNETSILIDTPIFSENKEYKFQFRKILENSNLVSIIVEAVPDYILNNQSELKGKMYDLIMHTSPEPMFIYDIENLSFIEVNHAALKLYGFARDEFLEMDLTDLYAPEDIQTLIESSPSKTTTSEFTGPYRHKHKNGSTILVEISKSMLEYDGKKAHFNIVRDVTELLEEKKELKKYKSVFEHSSDLLVTTDSDGFISTYNKNFLETLGYDEEALHQKPMLTLVTDEDRARLNAEIFHSEELTKDEFKTKLKKADGTEVPVTLFAETVLNYNDEVDSFNIIVKYEQEVQREIITREVPSTKAPIDSSFLSNLFHEILTPINVITGFVQELSESIQNPDSEQSEAINYIKDNQQLLLQIMDNAVEYSSLEQNEFEISSEPIVFVEILEEIEDNVIKFAKSREVEFNYGKISSSLKFESDKSKFSTFVSLLARFAVSATSKGKLYLSAYQKSSEAFVISFKDDRQAVSDELVKNLKDIFTLDENIIKQNFGISRFAVRLARKLSKILKVRRDVIKENGQLTEFSFDFPLALKGPEISKIKTSDEETVIEPDVIIEDDEPSMSIETEAVPTSVQEKQEPQFIPPNPKPDIPQKQTAPTPQPVHEEPDKEVTVAEESAQKRPVIQPQERNFSELRCLYVEDQIDSQILFKVQMKDLHSVEFATSFEKALPLLQNKQFDFIVMDINLQGEYNGLDALRAIQKMPGFQNMPIIAVTAYVLPGDREKFIAAGFVDFITKPILRDKLENVLKKIFIFE